MFSKKNLLPLVVSTVSCILVTLLLLAMGTSTEAQDMASVIEGAKKEGKVVFYTGMTLNPDTTAMVAEFEKKYPFVKVQTLRLSGENLLTRALTEARAKTPKADIFQASVIQVSQMKENGLLMKYIPPEGEAYGKFRDPEGFWTGTYILPYVITYNTKLISRQEAPKKYEDLLDPKWKGKIGLESEEYQWFFHLIKIMGREKGIDYMKALSKQNLEFRKGHPLLNTLCTSGEIPIVVVCYLNEIEVLKTEGAPLEWVRFESFPTITAINGISIVKTASNPNAAKLFYNFMISKDGTDVFRKVFRVPARPGEEPAAVRGLDLYPAFPDELLADYKQVVKEWEEIFHPPR